MVKAGEDSVQKKLGSSGTVERMLPYFAIGGAGSAIDPLAGLAVASYGSLINNPYTNIAFREGLSGASNLLTRSAPYIGSTVGQDISEANKVNQQIEDLLNTMK